MPGRYLFITVIGLVAVTAVTAGRYPPEPRRFETAQFVSRKEPDIDMFLSHWKNSKPRKMFGALEVRDILTRCRGDALRPRKKGAVLTALNAVSYAVLPASASTRPRKLVGRQQIYYVNSGEGVIETAEKTAVLTEGVGVLVPPNVEFTLKNTGDVPLTMYMVEEPIPDGFVPRKGIVVKYEYDNEISTNLHRVDSGNWLFSVEDGLSTLVSFNPIMFEPRSFVPLHVHGPGVEEVWIALKGELHIQVGRQQRLFPVGSAYKVPADGVTPHTNINKTAVSKKLLWMMKVPLRRRPVEEPEPDTRGVI